MKYICYLFFALLLVSCKPSRPYGILSEEEMEDIMVDYHLALAMAELQVGDLQENRYILTQAALKKHGITEAELDTSLVYWCRHSEKFVDICEEVTKRLNFMAESQGIERQERNPYSYLKTEGDTANVWNLRNSVVLIPNVVDNIYSFSIDADSTYNPGDYFTWAFKTQFLSSDRYSEAYAILSVTYANDSIVGTSQRLGGNRQTEIRMACPEKCKNLPIRSVNGTIYMPLREQGFGILAVNNFVLVRYHDLDLKKKREKQEEVEEDSVEVVVSKPEVRDSARVRQNPYDIRNEQADERTINIVRDKPIRKMRRR